MFLYVSATLASRCCAGVGASAFSARFNGRGVGSSNCGSKSLKGPFAISRNAPRIASPKASRAAMIWSPGVASARAALIIPAMWAPLWGLMCLG